LPTTEEDERQERRQWEEEEVRRQAEEDERNKYDDSDFTRWVLFASFFTWFLMNELGSYLSQMLELETTADKEDGGTPQQQQTPTTTTTTPAPSSLPTTLKDYEMSRSGGGDNRQHDNNTVDIKEKQSSQDRELLLVDLYDSPDSQEVEELKIETPVGIPDVVDFAFDDTEKRKEGY